MNNKGYLLVLGTAIISGVSIFVNQFGVRVINSDIFTGLKNIVVAVILLCLIFWFKEWKLLAKLKIKEWLTLVLIGLVGGSIPFLLFFRKRTTGNLPGLILCIPKNKNILHLKKESYK